jgi:hypothetical protein
VDEEVVKIPIMQCFAHIQKKIWDFESRKRKRAGKKLHFDPLPLAAAFKTVLSDDDDTLSMDTCDKPKGSLAYTTNKRDWHG